jgi:hypothetical protein
VAVMACVWSKLHFCDTVVATTVVDVVSVAFVVSAANAMPAQKSNASINPVISQL